MPAGLVATRYSGGGGTPPGTTSKFPARSWLTRPEVEFDSTSWTKAGPGADKTPPLARREAPAASGNGRGTIGLRFSARHPPQLRGAV